MIKVIHVLTDMNIGGAGKSVLNLLRRIDRVRFDIACVIPTKSLIKTELEALNIRIIEINGIGDKSFDPMSISTFIGVFRREKPDIVHTHAGLSARISAKCLGIVTVYTRHWAGANNTGQLKKRLNNALCDAAIGVSNAAGEAIIQTGISPEKVFVIYNGIEPFRIYEPEERRAARRSMGFDDSDYVIGTAARLEEEKGHAYLLLAAKEILIKYPSVRLVFAGEGSLKQTLLNQASDLGISDKVCIPGFVSDIEGFMNCLDLYVQPSVSEAFGLSIAEAMSVKCPCAATECGGVAEVIENKRTGLLAPSGDSDSLAKAIISIMNDRNLAQSLAECGFKKMQSEFTSKKMASQMEDLYKKLLGTRKK